MGATDKKKQKKTHQEPMGEKESVGQSELHKSLTRSATIRSRAMAEEIAHSNRSVLRHKLSVMAGQIGYFGLLVAACTVLLMMTRFCVEHYAIEGNEAEFSHLRYAVYYFIIGVTILVVAVPEGDQINCCIKNLSVLGLPLAVTLSLAYSSRKASISYSSTSNELSYL